MAPPSLRKLFERWSNPAVAATSGPLRRFGGALSPFSEGHPRKHQPGLDRMLRPTTQRVQRIGETERRDGLVAGPFGQSSFGALLEGLRRGDPTYEGSEATLHPDGSRGVSQSDVMEFGLRVPCCRYTDAVKVPRPRSRLEG